MVDDKFEQEYLFDGENEDKLQLCIANFNGPLDLLLALVKENKIEIKDIFVSQVTEQFLAYMTQLTDVDVDKASEYMAMAATLLEIKSRALLPLPEEELNNDDSPEKMLIRQLEEYKTFKEIVTGMKQIETVDRFYREPDKSVGNEIVVVKEKLDLDSFMTAFKRFMDKLETRVETGNVERAIVKETFTVSQKTAYIIERLSVESSFTFFELFNEQSERSEIITTLLAVLELLKLQQINVVQAELFENFVISKRPDAPELDEITEDNYDSVG